ncbi:hypothetical protein RFN25_15550 [Mesorhizobium abyssinicae]|uniref:hypothetical protein n=1 Tax=Mesorhizobium abyssinicae TaxID=1209958 RepID=UPI002A23E8F9|nr:hypothetical protein [Mesorhizobium abyssinicae]MDX8434843.1 hypothetical protein [Mesorhizobium abyssinicae]
MSVLTSIGTLTSRPAAFLLLLAYSILWMVLKLARLADARLGVLAGTWAARLRYLGRFEHRFGDLRRRVMEDPEAYAPLHASFLVNAIPDINHHEVEAWPFARLGARPSQAPLKAEPGRASGRWG